MFSLKKKLKISIRKEDTRYIYMMKTIVLKL